MSRVRIFEPSCTVVHSSIQISFGSAARSYIVPVRQNRKRAIKIVLYIQAGLGADSARNYASKLDIPEHIHWNN